MRLTQNDPLFFQAKVEVDGVEILDFMWADDVTGEVLRVEYGQRDGQGRRSEKVKLLKGTVTITLPRMKKYPR